MNFVERNDKIRNDFKAGKSMNELAAEHQIAVSRVRYIIESGDMVSKCNRARLQKMEQLAFALKTEVDDFVDYTDKNGLYFGFPRGVQANINSALNNIKKMVEKNA